MSTKPLVTARRNATLRSWIAATLLLVVAAAAHAQLPSLFDSADSATTIVVARVVKSESRQDGKLLVFDLVASDTLKGTATTTARIAQEIVFKSDKPVLADGANGILLLVPFPNYSAYRESLADGVYFRCLDTPTALRPLSTGDALRQWLASEKLPRAQQPAMRAGLLLDWLGREDLVVDALLALASMEQLPHALDSSNLTKLEAALRAPTIAVDTRRELVALLGSRGVKQAMPLLQRLTSVNELAAFARSALAKLGAPMSVDATVVDLQNTDAAQRLAALQTVGINPRNDPKLATEIEHLARHETNDDVRVEAIHCLETMGDAAVPTLTQLLADPDRRFVYKASQALAQIATPNAVSALEQQFESGSYEGQVAAVFALHEMATPRSLAILEQVRANPPDPRLKRVIDLANNEDHEHD